MRLAEIAAGQALETGLGGRGLEGKAAAAKADLFARAAAALARGGDGARDSRAYFVPGRIEVLGKHTDYAGGHSLVSAVEQGFCLVCVPRADERISVLAAESGESVAFAMDPALQPRHGHWSNYPMTVARRLARNFPEARRGADIAFLSDLPPASGMSSSSAMMVATYLGLAAANDLEERPLHRRSFPDLLTLAAYLGTVENGQSFGALAGDRGVGTFGGSEDHTAILCSRAGQLGQFRYCPARLERYLPMPKGHLFAVAFSGVVAEKTGAAQELYNRAAQRVGAIVQAWRQETGRDEVYLADVLASSPEAGARLRRILAGAAAGPFGSEELRVRLEHYIAENEEIIPAAGDALARADLDEFGRLVDCSQELTGSLLGNQVPQTVALARAAREQGAWAASAFGAGFGGSVWALVPAARLAGFLEGWAAWYCGDFPEVAARARFFATQAGPAAFEVGR
ncbi:MAG: galactokinase family protein [Candidatus Latescibacterota bacterium]